MPEGYLINLALIPLALGLLGFIEPCSMGSNLLFIKYLEGVKASEKIARVVIYTITRTVFTGTLGALVAVAGSMFLGWQKGMWMLLGAIYVLIGALYLAGKEDVIKHRIGVAVTRISGARGSMELGLLFGLNIPACAAPLIFAVLGMTAVGGHAALTGFLSMAVFGLALSLPLLLAILWGPARDAFDKLAGLSSRLPRLTGFVFFALGLWSVYFGLFVSLEKWK